MWNLPFVVLGTRRNGTLTEPDSHDRSLTWEKKEMSMTEGYLKWTFQYDPSMTIDWSLQDISYRATDLNLRCLLHILEQLGDCLNEQVDLLLLPLTQGNLFQKLLHLTGKTDERYERGTCEATIGFLFSCFGSCGQESDLTCILRRLQWNRLSASFSWFSSSAVGGLYRSLRDIFTGWKTTSSPGSPSGLLLLHLTAPPFSSFMWEAKHFMVSVQPCHTLPCR